MPALGDDARCRILTPDPGLTPAAAAALVAGLDKLFAQFAREDRLAAWSCTVEHDGAAVVLAWSPEAPLSGCSHDKLNRLFATHEERGGACLLTPPPICVQVDGRWRCLDRIGLRRLATADTPMLDHRLERLGDWRSRGLTTVGASWAARLLKTGTAAPSPT